MNDTADVASSLAFEERERVFGGGARMYDNRLCDLASERDEPREDIALRVARRMFVVIVEADFANGHHLGCARERGELVECSLAECSGVVRVDPDGRANALFQATGKRYGRTCRTQVAADSDDDESDDTCGDGALDDGSGPLGEVPCVEMAVRIDQLRWRRHARARA